MARLDLDRVVFIDKEAFTDWPEGDRREMDLLAKVPERHADVRVLIHVEIEADASTEMADRVWKYYMQLRLRHGLMVLSILMNLKGGRTGLRREVHTEGFEAGTVQFRYHVFSLSRCRAEEYLSGDVPLVWGGPRRQHAARPVESGRAQAAVFAAEGGGDRVSGIPQRACGTVLDAGSIDEMGLG